MIWLSLEKIPNNQQKTPGTKKTIIARLQDTRLIIQKSTAFLHASNEKLKLEM